MPSHRFEDMPPSVDERGCLYKPIAIPSRAANRSQQAAIQQVMTMRELDGPRRSSIVVTSGRSSGEKHLDRLEKVRALERAAKAAKAALKRAENVAAYLLKTRLRQCRECGNVDHAAPRGILSLGFAMILPVGSAKRRATLQDCGGSCGTSSRCVMIPMTALSCRRCL